MIGFAERELGGLHILVNNAGGGGHVEPHFPDAEPDQWRATLELNLGGAMLATQLALDPMRRAGTGVVVAGVMDAVGRHEVLVPVGGPSTTASAGEAYVARVLIRA